MREDEITFCLLRKSDVLKMLLIGLFCMAVALLFLAAPSFAAEPSTKETPEQHITRLENENAQLRAELARQSSRFGALSIALNALVDASGDSAARQAMQQSAHGAKISP